jgi:hypothetical protein
MLKSKRFLSLIAEIILFCIGCFLFKVEPVSLAGGLGIIFAPYQISQSLRSSQKTE